MGIFKAVVISAAIYGAYKFLTERNEFGMTRLDEIKEKAPQLLDKAKAAAEDLKSGNLPEGLRDI